MLEPDIRYGFERGLLTSEAVVSSCLRRLGSGEMLSAPAEAIALLLSDQLEEVGELVRGLESPVGQESRRLWMAICLEQARHLADPALEIENVYEFFEYDEALLPFVGWIHPGMPTEAQRADLLEAHLRKEKIWGLLRAKERLNDRARS